MKIPHWCSTLIRTSDLPLIQAAISQAESKTSGEIIPMIVRRSSTIGHVPLTLTFILGTLGMIAGHTFFATTAEWIQLPVIWGASFVLGLIISPLHWIQRWLTPLNDQILQVQRRAELEFYSRKMDHTRDRTAILLFVSLMEHRAVVLADQAIASPLPSETWNEVIDLLLTGIRQKKAAQGFTKAIEKSGLLLATHFPIQSGDKNEIHDKLIISE